jgi:hypothetical protein
MRPPYIFFCLSSLCVLVNERWEWSQLRRRKEASASAKIIHLHSEYFMPELKGFVVIVIYFCLAYRRQAKSIELTGIVERKSDVEYRLKRPF